MTIHIKQLFFSCIIGILDFEREQEQLVIIDLTLTYNYKDSYINYTILVDMIQEYIISKKFKLLEDALLSLFELIKQQFVDTKELYIKITKPSIMSNCTVAVSHTNIFS